MYVTLPVDVFVGHNLPSGFYTCTVTFAPCTVLIKKKTRRARLLYLFEHKFKGIRTVEKQYQNRDVCLVRLFHTIKFSVCAKLVYFLYTAKSYCFFPVSPVFVPLNFTDFASLKS